MAVTLPVNPLPRPETPTLEGDVAHVVFHEASVAVQSLVSRMGLNAHANTSAAAQALSVRPLSQRCRHLQPLRPGSALLRHWVRIHDPPRLAARRRQALSTRPHRAHQACLANPVLASASGGEGAIGDASGFPCRTPGCCTGGRSTNRARHCGDGTLPAMHHHAQGLGRHPNPGGHRDHARRLAMPLVLLALRTASAPWIPSPQPQPWP